MKNRIPIEKYFRAIHRNVRTMLNEELQAYGISESQLEYLVTVYENEGINQKELSEMLDVGKASVTKAIKQLIKKDLIHRKINPADNRNYQLNTTESGKKTGKSCEQKFDKIHKLVLLEFSWNEVKTLSELLERMYTKTSELTKGKKYD